MPRAAVALLLALACTSPTSPGAAPSSPTDTRSAGTVAPTTTPPDPVATPTVRVAPGTAVLLAQVSGRGSRTVGPVRVTGRFEVVVVCVPDGRSVDVQVVGGVGVTAACTDDGFRSVLQHDPLSGTDTVSVSLTATPDTRWALVVTTPEE